jgi:membrane fusion protein (multidrug efflux system)
LEANKVANVAKVPPIHEEEERPPRVVEQPARGPRGFFEQRPYAKWVLALAALAIVAGVAFVWHYYSARESTDDAQIDGHIDPLSPRVSGTVLRVLHDDNEVVSAGELLVELDPKDYEVALQRAQADLADAEANSTAAHTGIPLTSTTSTSQLAAADAGVIAAEREVEAANARVAEAQANHDRIETDLKRISTLVQHDEVSRQEYDTAVAAEKSSKAALDAARSTAAMSTSRVAQARAQADSSHTVPEQIKMTRARAGAASAEVERARASLAQAQLNLQYTKIYAPVAGILSKRSVEQGQVVQAGQPLFSLVNLDDLWVTANFKETQLRDMHTGQKVKVRVDAYDRDYDATVESVGAATGARFSLLPPENATGNYVKVVQRVPVRIRIDKGQDPQHLLRPGLSVEPTVFLK